MGTFRDRWRVLLLGVQDSGSVLLPSGPVLGSAPLSAAHRWSYPRTKAADLLLGSPTPRVTYGDPAFVVPFAPSGQLSLPTVVSTVLLWVRPVNRSL